MSCLDAFRAELLLTYRTVFLWYDYLRSHWSQQQPCKLGMPLLPSRGEIGWVWISVVEDMPRDMCYGTRVDRRPSVSGVHL